MKIDDVILGGGLGMMMVDDGGGRGVKDSRKSDDVINGRPQRKFFRDSTSTKTFSILQIQIRFFIQRMDFGKSTKSNMSSKAQ